MCRATEGKPHKPALAGIFFGFLKTGIIGFGGGSALIPVVEREFVAGRGLLDEAAFLKHTVIANITPGALPVKLGATCGLELAGPAGSLAGSYMVMVPGMLCTLLILSLFSFMGEGAINCFNFASVGISAFIVFLLLNYVRKTLRGNRFKVNLLLCAAAFLLTGGKKLAVLYHLLSGRVYSGPVIGISTIQLMLLAFAGLIALTLFQSLRKGAEKKTAQTKLNVNRSALAAIGLHLGIPLVLAIPAVMLAGGHRFIAFVARIAFSTISSFGGGEVYVSVADGIFVQSGIINTELFYTRLVPVVNALPGPILIKIAAGMAYIFAAYVSPGAAFFAAITAAACAVGVCSSIAVLVSCIYDTVRESALVHNLKNYILPVICGMLLSTSCAMLAESLKILGEAGIGNPLSFAGIALWITLLFVLTARRHIKDIILLAVSTLAGLAVMLV